MLHFKLLKLLENLRQVVKPTSKKPPRISVEPGHIGCQLWVVGCQFRFNIKKLR